jgi:hypothetical protein
VDPDNNADGDDNGTAQQVLACVGVTLRQQADLATVTTRTRIARSTGFFDSICLDKSVDMMAASPLEDRPILCWS